MARPMGFDFGLGESEITCHKRKFRWLLKIPEVSASGINSLPPLKSARPSFNFKETEARHLNEDIFFPTKSEWKPISLVLYDLKRDKHPVFEWMKKVYNPCNGNWNSSVGTNFKVTARLELYDGCGEILETWIYENAWPQVIEFGDLDMASGEYLVSDLTLRYDRAFIEDAC